MKDVSWGGIKKIFVKDITYPEALDRGKHTIIVRWLPYKISSYEDLIASSCGT